MLPVLQELQDTVVTPAQVFLDTLAHKDLKVLLDTQAIQVSQVLQVTVGTQGLVPQAILDTLV